MIHIYIYVTYDITILHMLFLTEHCMNLSFCFHTFVNSRVRLLALQGCQVTPREQEDDEIDHPEADCPDCSAANATNATNRDWDLTEITQTSVHMNSWIASAKCSSSNKSGTNLHPASLQKQLLKIPPRPTHNLRTCGHVWGARGIYR